MSTRFRQPETADRSRFREWLFAGERDAVASRQAPHAKPTGSPEKAHPWWQVMCLTGVDYFSTLGYQPGIAALAAGLVSPVATLVLVLLTLLGALPVYRRVARESPHGQGSIAMLERLFPFWWGKLFVLVLLGFALTDFLITITLSAADAAAHAIENPFAPSFLHGQNVLVALFLVALLGVVFLRGFAEAIGIAVGLVVVYLGLNLVVIVTAAAKVFSQGHVIGDWGSALLTSHSNNPWLVVGIALLVFPKLALGLSGFETGVTMMPLVRGAADDDPVQPAKRIRRSQRMLLTAAVIMSVFLITSSLATTLLIPQAAFQPGGAADGRALAYLAHEYLGNGFGTAYDVSTILILWFAGASAMAGMLNLVPRYMPRYGMAPEWTRLTRPLVVVFVVIGFVITILFKADVNAQGGAYATGVLVLMLSATVAVTVSAWRRGSRRGTVFFGVVALVFAYTTVANVVERPEGVKIASFFILAIVVVSITSRALRSTELRVDTVTFDETARAIVARAAAEGQVRLVAHDPDGERDLLDYLEKEVVERTVNNLGPGERLVFVEVTVVDASDFVTDLAVRGELRHGYEVLTVSAPTIPNAIAAILLAIREQTGVVPEVYFEWMEGNPIAALLRYLFFGGGDVAPLTREVLRQAEPDPDRRPAVHVD
ncbi:APC family permease [Lapillicoccus jejuensis]|uniref:APC family permease n=1 Tax=Lapillicoccus jejuensis TaxID=402171 RepID=UPI0011510AD5|nr:APC family permease [Lapillicoccus jejuensis]